MSTIRVRYEKGVFRPLEPVPLSLDEGQEIQVDLPSNEFF